MTPTDVARICPAGFKTEYAEKLAHIITTSTAIIEVQEPKVTQNGNERHVFQLAGWTASELQHDTNSNYSVQQLETPLPSNMFQDYAEDDSDAENSTRCAEILAAVSLSVFRDLPPAPEHPHAEESDQPTRLDNLDESLQQTVIDESRIPQNLSEIYKISNVNRKRNKKKVRVVPDESPTRKLKAGEDPTKFLKNIGWLNEGSKPASDNANQAKGGSQGRRRQNKR
jgi:hypothetical protein